MLLALFAGTVIYMSIKLHFKFSICITVAVAKCKLLFGWPNKTGHHDSSMVALAIVSRANSLDIANYICLSFLLASPIHCARLRQDDKMWDWDRLFTEVTSELLTEWENKEDAEQKSGA